MTRKQLEDLGLTKEQADSVMKINGDDIEKGWLKYCDSSRLSEKYIEPIQPYADRYYKDHIKKGGKKHERVRKSTQYKAA